MFKMIPSYYKYAQEYGAMITDNIKFPVLVDVGDVVSFNVSDEIIESELTYGAVYDDEISLDTNTIVKNLLFVNINNWHIVAAYNCKLARQYTKLIDHD